MDYRAEFLPEPLPESVMQRIDEVVRWPALCRYADKGSTTSETAELERDFSSLLGKSYALAVNSGGSAILVALLAAGVRHGDKVLLPAFTFTAAASAIVNIGAEPILVDTSSNYCIDTDDLESKIESGAHFFLLSYMRGHAANLDKILDLCKRAGIIIIEDCAHSLGTTWKGLPTGTFGIASCFSFQDKLINAGEGGMLVTNDADLYMRAVVLSGCYEDLWRTHSSRPQEENRYQGKLAPYSLRMSNITASIVRSQIPRLSEKILRYRHILNIVRIKIADHHYIVLPRIDENVAFVSDTLQFALKDADADIARRFSDELRRRGIPIAPFGAAPGNARCYWNWEYFEISSDVKRTRGLLDRSFDLRLRTTMNDAFAEFIGSAIGEVATWAMESNALVVSGRN